MQRHPIQPHLYFFTALAMMLMAGQVSDIFAGMKHPALVLHADTFIIDIAQQFHAANKLPHLTWIFPNAPHNHEAMTQAWYTPTSFSPIPVGRSSTALGEDAEEEEEHEEEEEILQSVEYIYGLVDEEIKRGVDLKRIVIGGFSQGCAVSVVAGLAGRYKGQFGGIVGLSGYLPEGKKIRRERESYVKGLMKVFLGHGTKDMLVPVSCVYLQTSPSPLPV